MSGPDDFPDNSNNKGAQRTLVVSGPLKVKHFEARYGTKLEFPGGGGRAKQKMLKIPDVLFCNMEASSHRDDGMSYIIAAR